MQEITIPYKFEPREYQLPLYRELDRGKKRAILRWHRRAGKDKCVWNYIIKRASKHVGLHYYFLPTYNQARKVIWDGIDNDGFKFTDHVPDAILASKHEQQMKITLKNGSIIQLVGTDNIDSVRGTNPITCVFSEYAYQNPAVWDVIRPILTANGGLAVFISTPNGKNHFYDMWEYAINNPSWFCQELTIEDTGFITEEDIEEERASGMSEDMIQQEYYVSFDAGVVGSFYADQIKQARNENRICKVQPSIYLPVYTVHDIGVNDTNAIWFYQKYGKEIRVIDYYENSNKGLDHYVNVLKEKGYTYANHYLPHDIRVREYTTGKSRLETLRELLDSMIGEGESDKIEVLAQASREEGIQRVRSIFQDVWFDEERCDKGLRCLQEYRREYDEDRQVYKKTPLHNWASNGCFVAGTPIMMSDYNWKNIEEIKIGEYVITPTGTKKVLNSNISGVVDEIYDIEFSNGAKISCTGNHKIFTKNGLKYADTLSYDNKCYELTYLSWILSQLLNIKAKLIGFRKAQDITGVELMGLAGGCMLKYGKSIMEKFQTGFTFITKILTKLTTQLKTLNVFQRENIQENTSMKDIGKIKIGTKRQEKKTAFNILGLIKILIGLKNFSQLLLKKLRNGIRQKKVESGIQKMVKILGILGKLILKPVYFVASNMRHFILPEVSIVQITARQVSEEKVYNLTIEKDHCYYANGILVSNSDAFRYLAMSLDLNDSKPRDPNKPKFQPAGRTAQQLLGR